MPGQSENPVDKRILTLLAKHHVMTLATVENGKPWVASCFYVYLKSRNLFVFTSDPETKHGHQMLVNPDVAGNITLETAIPGKIRGLQMSGKVTLLRGEDLKAASQAYLLRFPVAVLMNTTLWGFQPGLLKMTDNRLGFGVKLYWRALGATD
jgi:uncharacterized protein YhbP (UPF0306 family)